jgi:O-antigen ligase
MGLIQMAAGRTVYRFATEQEILTITAYFLSFFLARQLFVKHEARKLATSCFTIFGALLAIFAIVQKLQGNGRIYWLRASATPAYFGTYANKNHYAGLMEMLIPFALVGAAGSQEQRSLRLLCAFSASVMIASVFLSGSRSGSVIVMLELLAFASVTLLARKPRPPGRTYSLFFGVCAITLVLWLGGQSLIEQSTALSAPASDASFINRRQLTLDSLVLVKQRPILGWGLGTFSTVYPQAASWYGDTLVNAAHDDYLQALVETGLIGFGVVALFLVSVIRRGFRQFARTPSSIRSAAFLGVAGVLLHSFLDFNLHVPANAAMLFALCGLVCSD